MRSFLYCLCCSAAAVCCAACGGPSPQQPELLPQPVPTHQPASPPPVTPQQPFAPAEPGIELDLRIEVSGVALRTVASTEQAEPLLDLRVLELKQGGRLIFPGDVPDSATLDRGQAPLSYHWRESGVKPLSGGQWRLSGLTAGQLILLQVRYAPAFHLQTNRWMPPGSNYFVTRQILLVVPREQNQRASVSLRYEYGGIDGYWLRYDVAFDSV